MRVHMGVCLCTFVKMGASFLLSQMEAEDGSGPWLANAVLSGLLVSQASPALPRELPAEDRVCGHFLSRLPTSPPML